MTGPDSEGGNPPHVPWFDRSARPPSDRAPERMPDRFDEPAQLELVEDDVRLPWLEGDEEYEEGTGIAPLQVLALVLAGVVLIGVVTGGLWWFMHGRHDEPLVATGGIIAAPKGPYKVRPSNPGGDVVAGTGDTAFAVAEGQRRPMQMSGGDTTDELEPALPEDKPAPAPSASATATPRPAPTPSASAPASGGGVGVQVGAYSTRDAAERGWQTLQQQNAALAGVGHRIVQGQADIGTVYRLQATPGDLAAARNLCATLRGSGQACQVKQ